MHIVNINFVSEWRIGQFVHRFPNFSIDVNNVYVINNNNNNINKKYTVSLLEN
jgi:hypothetical protein